MYFDGQQLDEHAKLIVRFSTGSETFLPSAPRVLMWTSRREFECDRHGRLDAADSLSLHRR